MAAVMVAVVMVEVIMVVVMAAVAIPVQWRAVTAVGMGPE
jgi:hypothetical protein